MSPLNSPTRDSSEESTPLLSRPEASLLPTEPAQKTSKPWLLILVLVILCAVTIDAGGYLEEPPKTRVFEANLCLRYYREHDPSKINKDGTVDETFCKINAVQSKLASVMGWSDLFEAMPGIFLAVPYGILADRFGRKWLFVLSLVGVILDSTWVLIICYFRNLPLQLTWLASVFLLIGGGPIVATAIALTIISDIAPPDKRTYIFLYLSACILVAELLAPIIAAALMKNGDWFPLLLGLGLQCAAVVIALFSPETLHLRDLPEEQSDDSDEDSDNSSNLQVESPKISASLGFKAQMRNFREAMHFMKRDFALGMIIFSFFAGTLGRQCISLLLRYASQRYGWSIREASYLLSLRAAANLVALMVVIPLVNHFLRHSLHMSPHKADLWLARGSAVLSTFSFCIMGISATPVLLVFGLLIFNLGTGFNAAMLSLAVYTVGGPSSSDIGRLMASIAILEGFGAMLSGPILNGCFQWGMRLGKAFLGLPFAFAAVIFVLVAVASFTISVRDVNNAHVEAHAQISSQTTNSEARRASS